MNLQIRSLRRTMWLLGLTLSIGLSLFGWRVAAGRNLHNQPPDRHASGYRLEYTVTGAPRLVRVAAPAAALAQTDIPAPPGSALFPQGVTVLPNGNIVAQDVQFSGVGGVHLFNGADLSLISTLTGSTGGDSVGISVTVLTNGNFVVGSRFWKNGGISVGAATWCNGTTGCNGTVSTANSLFGGTAGDEVGNGVVALTNGNYVVVSPSWDNPATGATQAGAVTWGDGMGGTAGMVSDSNSLIGAANSDSVGGGGGGVTMLPNGNYVVRSPNWRRPPSSASAGAATWGNGQGGTVGLISDSNSLIGGNSNDQLSSGGVTVLANGNYVVRSPQWDNFDTLAVNGGAVTWGNGATGTVGIVTGSNSLIGARPSDQVGSAGVAALTNGHYVVGSPNWDNPAGPLVNAGAATWCNGTGGTVGLVSTSNSLVGGLTSDNVGGVVTALTNGNYVVGSAAWNNPMSGALDVGAATWCNGASPTVGLVSTSNSLIGDSANDNVGTAITALTNGNYVVRSLNWDNPTGPVANVGAVTWGNGATGTTGVVSASNSLIGGTAEDQVGNGTVPALTNDNYVVTSTNWDNPETGAMNAGAATWCNGSSPTAAVVTAANSLVGSTTNDASSGMVVIALTNGNYVVRQPNWDNPVGPINDVGAVAWGNGTTGTSGAISAGNALVGGTNADAVGNQGIFPLANGHYMVFSNSWDKPMGPANAGAVTLGHGMGGTVGLINATNSVLGAVSNDINVFTFDPVRNRMVVGRLGSDVITLFDASFFVPPTISKAFNPTTIQAGAMATVTLTLTNPNAGPLTNASFSDTLTNMSAVGGAVGGTCTGTTPGSLTAGATALSFSGITIPASGSCTVSFDVTSSTPGVQPNQTSGVTTAQTAAGDPSNTANLTVTCPTIVVSPATVPEGRIHQPYPVINFSASSQLRPAGSVVPYTFMLTGTLPAGLNFANGVLSGTPTQAGSFNFTITATETATGCTGSTNYTLIIKRSTVKADFDGDGKTDLSVWRGNLFPAPWRIINSGDGSMQSIDWGTAQTPVNDEIVPGDYDGDGKTDVAVFRRSNGHWYIQRSSDGGITDEFWGLGTDEPVPGDYDGDGKTDVAVFRASANAWYIKQSSDGMTKSETWGTAGDTPVPGDYDGDGKTDVAVWRGGVGGWYIKQSSDGMIKSETWGTSNAPHFDVPVPADYDGDGKYDVAVWRGAMTNWYILKSSDGQTQSVSWGTSAAPYFDVPVPGDYDGDGKADVGVWRPLDGNWLVIRSSNGTNLIQQHGQNGDTPVLAKGVR